MRSNYSNWTPRSFMEEFFSPIKYERRVDGKGTKSEPFVINRPQIIDRIYHGWYDEKDGSYHEILIENEE